MAQAYHTLDLTAQDVLDAVEANRQALKSSRYRSVAFEFARFMYNHRAMGDIGQDAPYGAVERIEPILESLQEQGKLPYDHEDPWKAALGDKDSKGNEDEPLDDFETCWMEAKGSPLERALRRARATEKYKELDAFGPAFRDPRKDKGRLLMGWMRELARDTPNNVFYISQRQAATHLKTSRPRVSAWVRQAVAGNIVERVGEATRRKAQKYLWIYDVIESEAPSGAQDGPDYMGDWNTLAERFGWPTVEAMTPERQERLSEREREASWSWPALLDELAKVRKDWTDGFNTWGFDWAIDNYVKILEGNYRDKNIQRKCKGCGIESEHPEGFGREHDPESWPHGLCLSCHQNAPRPHGLKRGDLPDVWDANIQDWVAPKDFEGGRIIELWEWETWETPERKKKGFYGDGSEAPPEPEPFINDGKIKDNPHRKAAREILEKAKRNMERHFRLLEQVDANQVAEWIEQVGRGQMDAMLYAVGQLSRIDDVSHFTDIVDKQVRVTMEEMEKEGYVPPDRAIL